MSPTRYHYATLLRCYLMRIWYLILPGSSAKLSHITYLITMNTNPVFDEVIGLLLDVKRGLQKMKHSCSPELINKIDTCITRIAPLNDVWNSRANTSPPKRTNHFEHHQHIHQGRNSSIEQYRPRQTVSELDSPTRPDPEECQEQLNKVKRSFFKLDEINGEEQSLRESNQSIILDYFVFKYDLKLRQYVIMGRKGGAKTDRSVFLDLFTDPQAPQAATRLKRTASMTAILKQVYTPPKVKQPFILPNCQEQATKYLFVFSLNDYSSQGKEVYRCETLVCFVSKDLLVGELRQLMEAVAKRCFEQMVSETAPTEESELPAVISQLNSKRTYLIMEKAIEDFLRNCDLARMEMPPSPTLSLSLSMTSSGETKHMTPSESYLQKSGLCWSLLHRPRAKQHQKFAPTLVVMFYFALSQQRMVLLAETGSRQVISQLMVGLLYALKPLTYIYPIVAATISQHHTEFANSPVPLMVGFWGSGEQYRHIQGMSRMILEQQSHMSKEEIQRQTLMGLIDLQEHTCRFLPSLYQQVTYTIDKIQHFLQTQEGTMSSRLGQLVQLLLVKPKQNEEDWMGVLRKKLRRTQMYEYWENRETIQEV